MPTKRQLKRRIAELERFLQEAHEQALQPPTIVVVPSVQPLAPLVPQTVPHTDPYWQPWYGLPTNAPAHVYPYRMTVSGTT